MQLRHGRSSLPLDSVQIPEFDGVPVLVTMLAHTSGQWLSSAYELPQGATPQDMGKAITYGRRYSLAAMVGITAEEDDDAAGVEAKTTSEKKPPKKEAPKDDPFRASVMELRSRGVKAFSSYAPDQGPADPTKGMDAENWLVGASRRYTEWRSVAYSSSRWRSEEADRERWPVVEGFGIFSGAGYAWGS